MTTDTTDTPTELTFSTGRVLVGSCLDRLKELDDASVDSIVTDPPYELGFMGKAWDASGIAYNVDLWRECLRVLKPGGHLLAFGGTRTYHRMAVAIEDAGFEIRDSIHWLYGSGFPKSLDVSKAIDKAAGAEREVVGSADVGPDIRGGNYENANGRMISDITVPATDAAKQWAGWGTALKPAHEPIVVARKPLDGTVAACVLEHGTGALNIDGCRVGTTDRFGGGANASGGFVDGYESGDGWAPGNAAGRWPANIVFTHAAECGSIECEYCAQGLSCDCSYAAGESESYATWTCVPGCPVAELDEQSDGASRFFTVTEWSELDAPFRYVAKPGKKERDGGLDKLDEQEVVQFQTGNGASGKPSSLSEGRDTKRRNTHPTVKPVALMRWLVRLVTPAGGTVLDPFLGSGTTAVAAIAEGFQWIGCEMTADYLPIIEGRVTHAEKQRTAAQPKLFEDGAA